MAGGVEYQVTKVDPTSPQTKGMVHQVHKVSEEIAATIGGKVYRARIINDPTAPTVAGKVYQIVLIDDPDDPSVKGMVYNAILTGGSEAVVVGPAVSPLSLPDAGADSLTYVKAFGGTEQHNLPAGYTQLEYIESTGTQYINTGFTPNQDTSIETKAQLSASSGVRFFASYGPSSNAPYYGVGFSGSGKWVNQTNTSNQVTNVNADTNLHTIYKNKNVLYVDGAQIDDSGSGDFTSNYSIYLLAANIGGSTSFISAGKMYYAKIWDGNTLVRNFIPCKNASNVVGMYDTINGVFYQNGGTGDFVAGDAAVPTPNTPMNIVTNNGVLKARHQSGLPLGYTLLDYIQSSGSQYIDTLRVPNNNDIIEQKFKKNGTNTATCSWYGSMPSSSEITPRIGIGSFSSQSVLKLFAGSNYTGILADADAQVHTLRFQTTGRQELTYTLDGVTDVIDASTASTPIDMYEPAVELTSYLFARHGTNGVQVYGNEGTRIYYHREYLANGTLVLNMVPCKNASNVLGMYDLVSGTFFTNQGTGDFVAGNTVSDPVEIYTDGTVETIDVHGKNLFDKNSVTPGYYYTNTGVYTQSTEAGLSDWMAVSPNTTYTITTELASGSVVGANRRVNYFDSNKNWLSQDVAQMQDGTKVFNITTPSNAKYLRISYPFSGIYALDNNATQIEQGSTATDYEPYFNGGTATTEMLLKVGDYQDVQSIIDGVVTRKVGVKVLDGTENWAYSAGWSDTTHKCFYATLDSIKQQLTTSNECLCSHFEWYSRDDLYADKTIIGGCISGYTPINPESGKALTVRVSSSIAKSDTDFTQWLADQYAAGTPVTIVYPLATETTESVAGQTLQVQDGDNTLEITQASLDGLQLEAEYEKEA